MKTYYIVEHTNPGSHYKSWHAHGRGIITILGVYNYHNYVEDTRSTTSADDCEYRLRNVLRPVSPKVVRVVRL